VRLNGILQGVSLKGEIQNYLDFVKEDGTSFKLPVPEETVQALLAEIYGTKGGNGSVKEAAEGFPEEQPDGATVFGEEDHQGERAPVDEEEVEEEDEFPQDEDEVPPL
jgi:hypothetical protein